MIAFAMDIDILLGFLSSGVVPTQS